MARWPGLLVLAACAHTGRSTSHVNREVADVAACPSADTQPVCGDPGALGTTVNQPLAWGVGASLGKDTLYYGRLTCLDGADPKPARMGSAAPDGPIDAPLDPRAPYAGYDVLDQWMVQCPTDPEPRALFVDLYRCGSPCPPAGLRLLDPGAAAAMSKSRDAFAKGDGRAALDGAELAVGLEPAAESTLTWLSFVELETGKPLRAIETLERAQLVNPKNPYHTARIARAWRNLGDSRRYEDTLRGLVTELPESHPLAGELSCELAWFERDRSPASADVTAAKACRLDFVACCPPQWTR